MARLRNSQLLALIAEKTYRPLVLLVKPSYEALMETGHQIT
jgi:hypothetical protein